MRLLPCLILCAALGTLAVGCSDKKGDYGPTVDAFTGRLVKDGKPVSFSAGQNVELKVITEKAQRFGIPISPDGTFKIGWMPIGKYSAILVRQPEGQKKGGPDMYNVPGGFEIVAGKTDYEIELGKNFK